MKTKTENRVVLKASRKKTLSRGPNQKNWVFTLNNYDDEEVRVVKEIDCKYLVFGFEVSPTTNVCHLQGFIQLEQKARLAVVKTFIPRAHWEPMRITTVIFLTL